MAFFRTFILSADAWLLNKSGIVRTRDALPGRRSPYPPTKQIYNSNQRENPKILNPVVTKITQLQAGFLLCLFPFTFNSMPLVPPLL